MEEATGTQLAYLWDKLDPDLKLAGNTWDDEIVSFREALINAEKYDSKIVIIYAATDHHTHRHWWELGIPSDCPYHFTNEELMSHAIDAGGWNEVQKFFDTIEDLVERGRLDSS